jgi:hypothetical protein
MSVALSFDVTLDVDVFIFSIKHPCRQCTSRPAPSDISTGMAPCADSPQAPMLAGMPKPSRLQHPLVLLLASFWLSCLQLQSHQHPLQPWRKLLPFCPRQRDL